MRSTVSRRGDAGSRQMILQRRPSLIAIALPPPDGKSQADPRRLPTAGVAGSSCIGLRYQRGILEIRIYIRVQAARKVV